MYVLNKTVMRWKSRFRESLFHNFLKKNTPDLANFFRLRRSLGPPPQIHRKLRPFYASSNAHSNVDGGPGVHLKKMFLKFVDDLPPNIILP